MAAAKCGSFYSLQRTALWRKGMTEAIIAMMPLRTARRYLLGCLVGIAVALLIPSCDEGGCKTDRDCKADRVCDAESGKCVEPSGAKAEPSGNEKTAPRNPAAEASSAQTLLAKAGTSPRWSDTGVIEPKLAILTPLLNGLMAMDKSGGDVDKRTLITYVANMQEGFLTPVKYELEERLNRLGKLSGKDYYKVRQWLKTYLFLSEVSHLNDDRCTLSPFEKKEPLACIDWVAAKFTALWAELLIKSGRAKANPHDLKKMLRPHVRYYFELIRPRDKGKARATYVPANTEIVKKARGALSAVPVRDRYYGLFIESLIDELYDPAGDLLSSSNRKYPQVTLKQMFTDRPDVFGWLRSRQKQTGRGWKSVEGPYTDKGHYAVVYNIKNADRLLASDSWVIPLTDEEKGNRVSANLAKMRDDYEAIYRSQWREFLLDVTVVLPADLAAAVDLYSGEKMQKQEWAFLPSCARSKITPSGRRRRTAQHRLRPAQRSRGNFGRQSTSAFPRTTAAPSKRPASLNTWSC